MPKAQKPIRKSVTLPATVADRVRVIARTRKTSDTRVLVDLIEAGLQSKDSEKTRFFALADRLAASPDENERKRIKKELERMTFGECRIGSSARD
jgi:hypothetical protein